MTCISLRYSLTCAVAVKLLSFWVRRTLMAWAEPHRNYNQQHFAKCAAVLTGASKVPPAAARSPPHPGPLPLGGGEGESLSAPAWAECLPLPRQGGEGRGEGGIGGAGDPVLTPMPEVAWRMEVAPTHGVGFL